ncbi:ATP-dependent RNA helicase drs1 [Sphaceloma murrayae]|uniref:RNA helicase n=1 Tax=Sphaceloma murrayae TaxID=2082308 RepID=A0A2K1QJZ0_9PEZI|nr:ATP-dependent RNA helicase drs1 [Sphaceloma murrayae]
MAPSKLLDEDFVPTIYDDDAASLDEEEVPASEDELPAPVVAQTNGKKRKREEPQKSRKKQKQRQGLADQDEEEVKTQKDTADGEIDPDFDFQFEDGVGDFDDEQWGDAEKETALGTRSIDDIVAARKALKQQPGEQSENGDGEDDEEVSLSDEELLADDAFGMGAGSADEEDEEESDDAQEGAEGSQGDDDEQGDDDDDDEEDIAAPVAHPLDLTANDASSDSEQEDTAETARRKAYFAPESNTETNAISTSSASFLSMSLSRPILRGLSAAGFSNPTPIQARTIPIALLGKDVVGSAVTGSGKTGAFMIPILERLFYRPREHASTRVVVLTPTRELALQCHQVATKLASFTDITFAQAIGGLNLKVQENALKLRPDIVIATPGRFIDFMRNSAALQTDGIEILVLDEADRMLEDGFADELNEILKTLPRKRQTMLFSATMTSSVDDLIRVGCSRPVRLAVDAGKQTVKGLVQEFIRLREGKEHLRLPYLLHLCTTTYTKRTIVFFRQKAMAHRVRVLFALLGLSAAELHGAMSQEQRIQAVEAFRSGKASFLLATDLAARGLDIKNVDGVVNFEAPQSHEIYLHRVGRTARAGRTGRCVTLAAEPDRKVVKAAVKSARGQGAEIKSRSVPSEEADKWEKKVGDLEDDIEAVMKEEKEEKVLRQSEMQMKKAENIMAHEKDILARPKKTWFQGQKDKADAKAKGRAQLNGVKDDSLEAKVAEQLEKDKGKKKLSNKEKKRLALKDERNESRMWKKGSAERGKKVTPGKPGAKGGKPGAKGKGKPKARAK